MAQTHSERPLSPHLQIYKPQMTSMLSILHRMTGAALVLSLFPFLWMLGALAAGPDAWDLFIDCMSSLLGLLVLAGWSFCIIYHALNGVRHLIWDMGYLFKIENATRAGYLIFYGALALTGLLWAFILI